MNLQEELLHLKNEALGFLNECENLKDLEDLKIKYLGRKGEFTVLLRKIPLLTSDEKAIVGQVANDVKNILENALNDATARITKGLFEQNEQLLDMTAPGIKPKQGHLHLVSQTIEEISSILEKIGFVRMRYPEVEWEWYAFEGLNIPKYHPARDDFESFYIDSNPSKKFGRMCLTPHTSNGQLREMERTKPPIRMTNIGKCYRPNYDASHTPMFHQFEGLVVDCAISITHLKGTFDYFAKQYFGPERSIRLRPFHFQFTEPSFEVDVTCGLCNGKGCNFCKAGWLELGGGGIVHPDVLKNGGIDTKKYSGFAFGWGVERVLMMKSGIKIPDMRILYQNDVRFLQQF